MKNSTKTTAILSEDDQNTLAHELKTKVSEWVQTFNFIQLDVLELVAERENTSLIECIRQEEITYDDIADFNGHYGDKKYIAKLRKDYPEIENCPDYDSVRDQGEADNYPMWNTCFEFKENEGEDVLRAAIDAGIGVIENLGDFNQILFFSGCGYSFYGSHWIPFYLNLPWNKQEKIKYAGVNYDNL